VPFFFHQLENGGVIMKLRLAAIIGMILFVLSACQLPGNLLKPATSSSNAKDSALVFATNTDPIQAVVKLDKERSVAAVIPVAGGTLSVNGADGTKYTLDIPGDALLTETSVRMTPVGSLTGLPFGSGEPLAVQLEPEGLFFNNFVTLTITPAQEIPIDQQILFGYKSSGQDVILAPPVVDSREIKIKLLHFSGYGVTKGLLADIEPVRQRIGGDAERRLQSLTAERLGKERQRQLLGSGEKDSALTDLTDLFNQFEEQVVKPRIAAAGESCAAGRLALQTALGFERQKQLLGFSENGLGQYLDLINTVGIVCVKEEYQMCKEDHIIHRMIPVWLGMSRQFQLLGGDLAGAEPEALKLAKDLTQKCLTFELQFESTGVFDDGGGGGYESTVNSKVKLVFKPDELKISGNAPLVNKAFTFKVDGCSVTSNRGGGPFAVMSLAYVSDTKSPTDELGYVRDFNLTYFPGPTSESFSIQCPDQPAFSSPPTGLWSGLYTVLHYPGEYSSDGSAPAPAQPLPDLGGMPNPMGGLVVPEIPAGKGFLLSDWEVFGKEYYAKKEWIKEDKSLGITETGTFKLYHRPG
jgi:hypothetical protein